MDNPDFGASGNFLERLLGDLLQVMGSSGPQGGAGQAALARNLAQGVATNGTMESNVDPSERIKFEEMARLAEMCISEIAGPLALPGGAPVQVVPVSRGTWASKTIDDWQFLIEKAPAPGLGAEPLNIFDTDDDDDQGGMGLFGRRLMEMMGPMLSAMQLGSAVGHLARSALGQYELPVPRTSSTQILVVPQNVSQFAEDWSLPIEQVRLWVCLREVAMHTVLSKEHVANRLRSLLAVALSSASLEGTSMIEKLGSFDPTNPESLQEILGDPQSLIQAEPTAEQLRATEQLTAITAAILGYVDYVLEKASKQLLGGHSTLTEAWRRRQVARNSDDRAAELMIGLDQGMEQVDRGIAFVSGVLERADEEGIHHLWESARTLPTPNEINAPGLWLERISFDLEDDGETP